MLAMVLYRVVIGSVLHGGYNWYQLLNLAALVFRDREGKLIVRSLLVNGLNDRPKKSSLALWRGPKRPVVFFLLKYRSQCVHSFQV